MSLFRATRIITAVRPAAWQRITPMGSRAMTSENPIDRESSKEKEFVARAERDNLRLQLARLNAAADPGNKKALAALEEKLSKSGVKVTEELKKSLLDWKHQH